MTPPDTIYIFIDMQIEIDSYEELVRTLEWEISKRLGKEINFGGKLTNMPKVFQKLCEGNAI